MRFFLSLSVVIVLFAGCAKSGQRTSPADEKKSCHASLYEYDGLKKRELHIYDGKQSETGYFHYGVVSAGVVASLSPYVVSGGFFFLFPALTIWYYNIFFEDRQKIENEQRIKTRLETLEMFLEKNRCIKGP